MLKIRLSRVGRTHEPVYRLVLTDHKNAAKSGKSLEVLGSFDSRRAEKAEFNAEKIKYWISKGAQMSDTVHNLIVKRGLLEGVKRSVLPQRVIDKANAPKEIEPPPETAAAPEEVPAEVPVAPDVVAEIVPDAKIEVEEVSVPEAVPEVTEEVQN